RRHTRFSRDWSSDVCSSDLVRQFLAPVGQQFGAGQAGDGEDGHGQRQGGKQRQGGGRATTEAPNRQAACDTPAIGGTIHGAQYQIGRASCRERRARTAGGGR